MKTFEALLRNILSCIVLFLGIVLVVLWFWDYEMDTLRNAVHGAMQNRPVLGAVWPLAGLLLLACGVMGLLSARAKRSPAKSISYPGTHGDVIIQLDSVEANLNRVLGKLREVKWISVTVHPDEERGKARVSAEVKLVKGPDESAAQTANRVSDRLADIAANLLGVDEVTHVDMIVKGISLGAAAEPAAPHPAEEPAAKRVEAPPKDEREAEPVAAVVPAAPAVTEPASCSGGGDIGAESLTHAQVEAASTDAGEESEAEETDAAEAASVTEDEPRTPRDHGFGLDSHRDEDD